MAYTKGDSPMRRRGGRRRRKVCAFCTEADAVIDYKDVATLKKYVSGVTDASNNKKEISSEQKRELKITSVDALEKRTDSQEKF